MKNALIYAGTTEGRQIAQSLAGAGVLCDVCVATEYGSSVIPKETNITVIEGRLDQNQMRALLESKKYDAVIDATHPFATAVTHNILESVNGLDVKYYRLSRDINKVIGDAHIFTYENQRDCAKTLADTQGNILLTTGSKELGVYCENENLRRRLTVRVLPGKESINLCYENGLEGRQIIAMQGPFGVEMNIATIRQYDIKHLVTKESGHVGGLDEKIAAACREGITCHVISKPISTEEKAYSLDMLESELFEIWGLEKKACELSVTLAGIGMGTKNSMTLECRDAIAEADYIFGAARMIEDVSPRKAKYPYYLEKDILPILDEIRKKENENARVVILFSGDTGFFSGCKKMADALDHAGIKASILPGISSVAALCAKIGATWQDAKLISTHGVEKAVWSSKMLHGIKQSKKIFFITSGVQDVQNIGELLVAAGINDEIELWLGYRLSYEDEKVFNCTPKECIELCDDGLYVGMIIPKGTSTSFKITPGISDDFFIRDKVPMTKEEVREISICKLGLTGRDIVYDIGCGTGSVALEIAAISPESMVYGVESNPAGVQLIEENKRKLGVRNLSIIQAMAPDGLLDLPKASHAFIGGSKGHLKEILDTLYNINPHMKVVMNAISMESIATMQCILPDYPTEYVDVTQVAISKSNEVGGYHLLQANNPVMIFSFEFKE